jgi:mRNA degradation ribonuclease J1/J2
MNPKNVFTLETGQVLEITNHGVNKSRKIHTGVVYVDGSGVGDVGNIVLRDRRELARDGMVTIVFAIERETYTILAGPDIITRGFIYARESEVLINSLKTISKEEVEKCLEQRVIEWQVLKGNVKKSVEQYIYEKTKRRPIVFPIIMEV